MKERGGIAATLALLLATILGISYIPRKAAESSAGQEAQKSATRIPARGAGTNQQAGTVLKPIASCEQIAKRLRRFYSADDKIPMPKSCFQESTKDGTVGSTSANPNLSFAIAIVPNPVQTHLPLVFDRAIESIQQAAQDVNYIYDGSWFPWNHSERSYELLSDEEQASKLEAELQQQPGIMVFRRGLDGERVSAIWKNCDIPPGSGSIDPGCPSLSEGENQDEFGSHYDRDLVVFVVAEQPTGGLSDQQFEHALQWMQKIRPEHVRQPLLILGPTFSGTLPSLARQLTPESLKPYENGMRIYSGTANSETAVRWFQLYLAKVQGGLKMKPPAELQFRTFFEGDGLMTDRFLCYLHHEGYDLKKVAILSEDETAYGNVSKPSEKAPDPLSCDGGKSDTAPASPINLYYPRDIASLRSAYAQQSIFAAGKQQGGAPATSLRGDLSEPVSNEHDTVRTYGGQLTPLAQESALFGITNLLDSKQIEFVIVRSTSSLDQLFLSEFLRRSYPSGRVVIDGADLLFRRGSQGASLRGVMLLSPYPLLSWTPDTIPPIHGSRQRSYRVFAEDLSEGVYIAGRELFEQLPDARRAVPISDYGAPKSSETKEHAAEADHRPATWVTVVGHRQFWPIAVLNEATEVETSKDGNRVGYGPGELSLLQPEFPEAGASANSGPVGASRGAVLPGEMSALLLFCAVLGLWHFYCCWYGSTFRPPRVRAYFAPIPHVQHPTLIFIGGLLLGLLAVTLFFAVTLGSQVLMPSWVLGVYFGVFAIFISGFLGCIGNYRLPVVSGDRHPRDLALIRRWRIIFCVSWLPVVGGLAWLRYLYLTTHLTAANAFPTFWRSVFLRSGVSPLLPQVVLIAGLYAWFWFNLHGLALFGDDRPVLPKVDDLPVVPVAANHKEEERGERSRMVKMFRMFSREGAGANIERNALPLSRRYGLSLVLFLVISLLVLRGALGDHSLRSLGDHRFGTVIFYAVGLCMALILADTLQLLNTWSQLRQLLVFLDRLRLRRTFTELRGLYGGSVWKLSGNVLEERYRLISRQFESMRHLQNRLAQWTAADAREAQSKQIVLEQLAQCEKQGRKFATWYVDLLDDDVKDAGKEHNLKPLAEFQELMAATAGCVLKYVIMPEWQTETQSLIRCADLSDQGKDGDAAGPCPPPHVRAAEEFVVLPYLGFIQNTLGRVRTIAFSIVSLFVAATVGVSCYPFDPLPVIGAVFLILFALVGLSMIFTYAEMCRDATLSHIANTNPGELGLDFFVKMATFGIGPLIGLLTTLFPSLTDFIVSFLQPGAQAFQ
ncbi:MAG TPA: hypothetical protein VIH91_13015 [Terriglobales bacterium]